MALNKNQKGSAGTNPSGKNKVASPAVGQTGNIKVADSNNKYKQDAVSNFIREEALTWILTILSALLVYVIAAKIIQLNYHPDTDALIVAANKFSFAGGARPEPVEALLFRAGIFIVTGCIFLFYFIYSRSVLLKKQAAGPLFSAVFILAAVFIGAMICRDFAAVNPFGQGSGEQPQNSRDLVGTTNFDFFFDSLFLGGHLLLYTFIIVPAIALFFYFGSGRFRWDTSKPLQRAIWIGGYVFTGALILAIVLMNTFKFPYSFENKYDFNAVYYSMTQVFAGLPMLVDGFSDTYGLYPHFLNPLFQIIGLDVFKFSLVMALLNGVAFLLNFYFLRKLVSNNVILFLGFASVIFLPTLDFKFLTPYDCSFATFPIRYIIPSALVVFAYLYTQKQTQLRYWLTTVFMAAAVLWNPEIGMVSYLSWIAFNVYLDFYTPVRKVNFKKILFHIIACSLAIAMIILLFELVFHVIYGQAPDLNLLFGYVIIFGKVGFGLLPMQLVHPWNINALVIILGFTLSIRNILRENITSKGALVFLVSVIATGFLVYFQGRSHNWPYASSSGFCFILLTLLGDELWSALKGKQFSALHLLFVIFLFLISFSFLEIIFNTSKINELVYQEEDKDQQIKEEDLIKSNTDFINGHTKEKEPILVFAARQYEGLYFDGNRRRSAFNPGYEDMFLNTDLDKLASRISSASYQIFIDSSFTGLSFLEKPVAAIAATYDIADTKNNMYLLHKRQLKIPAQTYFTGSGNDVLYRKYKSDTSGVSMRIADALGIKPVVISPTFSVEALFYASAQMLPYATLAGNMNDTSGFIIANVLHTPNYFFGINGKGTVIKCPEHQWVYCVMNVYPDHVEVYENGQLAATLPLSAPVKQSPEKLAVGNEGYFRYYTGAISEVAIHNNITEKSRISATWEMISKM
jgi:hypothetical protein